MPKAATKTVRVLIADDHGVLRDGLRILINAQRDMRVVGQVTDAGEVFDAVKRTGCHVLILDLSMPGGGGLAALERIRAADLSVSVLVLTMHDNTAYLRRALQAGAIGYVVKSAAGSQMLKAIRSVHKGRRFVDATLPEGGLDEVLASEQAAVGVLDPTTELSKREREVLRFVGGGFTNREAAEELEISVKTVEGYRERLGKKLGARSRADLVRCAAELGLLDPS